MAQTQLQMEEEVDLEDLREREQSIRKIESDIVDVNQIFKDLATMVHAQGEVIDSIEANVESAAIQVQEGASQLSKARDYQVCLLISLPASSIHCSFVPNATTTESGPKEDVFLYNLVAHSHRSYRYHYLFLHQVLTRVSA